MNAPELKSHLKKQPFVPLRIHMSDGRTFDIRHPEMAWVTVHTVHVGRDGDETEGIPSRVEYLSLRHIVSVEPLETHVPGEG